MPNVNVRVTLPPALDVDAFWKDLTAACYSIGETIKKDLEATTDNWAQRPQFTIERIDEPERFGVSIATEDPIWSILNQGAKPHPITGNPYLAFESGPYTAKTSPKGGSKRVKRSSYTRAPGEMVITPSVQHPGVEARKWDEQIKEKRNTWAQRMLSLALANACKKSKYGG